MGYYGTELGHILTVRTLLSRLLEDALLEIQDYRAL
jgi:hypothetical protein